MNKHQGAKRSDLYGRYIKRSLDIILSLVLISFLFLPMIAIAVCIRLDSKGEIIFKQKRCGRAGREFICYKFRTMYQSAPKNIPASSFSDYKKHVTRVGRFLRRSSLDELPQIFNVLRGDMSLVGPRPLIFEEHQMHEKRMREGVYELRPGITGMAQVRGRNLLDDDEKLENDRYYLDNLRLWLDLKICVYTLFKIFRTEGSLRDDR
jgi:O-antigen biosynthesis protein WbqP